MPFEYVIVFVGPICIDDLLSRLGAPNAIPSDSSSKSLEIIMNVTDPRRYEKKVHTFTCFDTSFEESVSILEQTNPVTVM